MHGVWNDKVSPKERVERIYDEMLYAMKYSAGGITEARVRRMGAWERRRWSDAAERLLRREQETKPKGEGSE